MTVVLGLAFLVAVALLAAGARRFDHVVSPVTLVGLGLFLYVVAIPVEVTLTGNQYLTLRSEIPIPDAVVSDVIPLAFLALTTFTIGYVLVVDLRSADPGAPERSGPDDADVRHAVRSLAVCAALAVVTMVVLFGPELLATRDYTSSYTERYESPLYALGLALTQVLVAMLGLALAHYGRHRLRDAALFAVALVGWGLFSNQKTPIVLAGLVALGWLTGRVRRPSGTAIGLTVAVMPLLLGVSAFAFSSFRGGGGLELSGRTGYLTNIEPAGPFVSIIDELTRRGSSAPDSGFGESILNGLIGWVPRFVWPHRPLDLAEQFARIRVPDWRPGEGYGYSPLAEAFHQGGAAGVAGYFLLLGLGIAVLRNLLLRRGRTASSLTVVTSSFYHVVFLLLLFTLFRGPLQAFVTTLVQYSAALVMALVVTALLPRRRAGRAVADED